MSETESRNRNPTGVVCRNASSTRCRQRTLSAMLQRCSVKTAIKSTLYDYCIHFFTQFLARMGIVASIQYTSVESMSQSYSGVSLRLMDAEPGPLRAQCNSVRSAAERYQDQAQCPAASNCRPSMTNSSSHSGSGR